jgi:hypothetical protein
VEEVYFSSKISVENAPIGEIIQPFHFPRRGIIVVKKQKITPHWI